MAIKSLYFQPEVCACFSGKQSNFAWVFTLARVCFVTSPFHNLHELDGQTSIADPMSVSI